MLSIEDLDDDFDKEDKMNNVEVKEIVTMECRRRRRLRSAMMLTTGCWVGRWGPQPPFFYLLHKWVGN